MGIDIKASVIHFGKAMVCSARVSFRFICSHPFVVVTLILSLLTYRFLPSLFAFFVSSSPVIVCTALLLGLLLSAGQRHAAEAEEDAEKTDSRIPSLKAGGVNVDLALKKTKSLGVRANVRKRSGPAEKMKKEVFMGERRVSLTPNKDREDELIGVRKMVAERGFVEKKEFHEDKQGGIAEGQFINQGKRIDKSSSGIPDAHLADRGDSSDSDCAESCSPDASVAEMAPRLDELHPLLDDEAPQQPAPSPSTASDTVSQHSSSQESENGSDEAIEDAENQDDVEEDEEAQEDGTEAVVKWTADDEKNLIHLGTSELERNRRLENLIAKRIASRKQGGAAVEKNLIDLESSNPLPVRTPIMEQFAHVQIQVPPPVFTTRHNPFDLPYSPTPGLPPVPGSAPSVLLPRRNPFDLPYAEPEGGSQMSASSCQAQVEPILHGDILFRRIESFTLGASVPMANRQERPRSSNLKPYFVAEQVAVNEDVRPTLQRQLSGEGDLKSSSILESYMSSVVDQEEDNEELNEQESKQRVQLNSYMDQEENKCSEDANLMETQPDQSHIDDIMVQEAGSNASDASSEMHEDMSSSSLSEQSDERIFETIADEQSNSKQAAGQGAPSTASITPVKVVHEVLDSTDYGPVEEPVYDSSPSATAKSSSNELSIAAPSDAQIGISEVSSPVPVERTIPLEDELEGEVKRIAFAKKDRVASTSLSFVDRNEARSREVSEVSEAYVIQAVLESSTECRPLEIHFVNPQSNADGMTDTMASEESVISIEESAARPSFEGFGRESQGKATGATSNDDTETKEITQSSTTLEMQPGNLRDKSASQLVDANMDAVDKNLNGSMK